MDLRLKKTLTTTTSAIVGIPEHDTELVFFALGGRIYRIRARLLFATANATTGIGFGLFAPDFDVFTGRVDIPSIEEPMPPGPGAGWAMGSGSILAPEETPTTVGRTAFIKGLATLEAIVAPISDGDIGVCFCSTDPLASVDLLEGSMMEIQGN